MADSANPVSPKLVAAGVGAVVAPIVIALITAVIDLLRSGTVTIPEPWQTIVFAVASVIGTVIGAYVKTDGLRLPTLEPAAVNELPNAELKLQDAALKLGDPLP